LKKEVEQPVKEIANEQVKEASQIEQQQNVDRNV
jgi:hypothetical protein